jgi:hypothetical protein
MTDPTTPESAATPVAATAPATPVPATEAPVAKKKGSAVGVWSFILGLLAVLGDLALIVFMIVTLFSAISSFQTGNYEAVLSALGVAGIGFLLFAVFIGGFIVAGLGALLGLIAIFTARGRVIGIFGFLLSAAALGTRIALITGGLNIAALNGG